MSVVVLVCLNYYIVCAYDTKLCIGRCHVSMYSHNYVSYAYVIALESLLVFFTDVNVHTVGSVGSYCEL